MRYSIAALKRDGRAEGYAVYRHAQEPRGRVTWLVDFLADTHDEIGFKTLLRWVDAEARAGRIGQDPLLRRAPRVPARHAALGIFPDAASAGAGGEDQRADRAGRSSTRTPTTGTSRSAIRIRIDDVWHLLKTSTAQSPKR